MGNINNKEKINKKNDSKKTEENITINKEEKSKNENDFKKQKGEKRKKIC